MLILKVQNVDSEGIPIVYVYQMHQKMGRLRRMLILKTSPHQQMVSLRWTEATNCTVTEHHPHQQMC